MKYTNFKNNFQHRHTKYQVTVFSLNKYCVSIKNYPAFSSILAKSKCSQSCISSPRVYYFQPWSL